MLCAAAPASIARVRSSRNRARQPRGRADRRHAEAGHQERMPETGRPEQRLHQLLRARGEGGNQVPVGARVFTAERLRRGVDRSLDDDRRPIVERMREGRFRLRELEAVRRERQRLEERREHHQRVHGGADVMDESRLGQFERPRGAADRRLGLEDADRAARARQGDGRGQAVGAGADHDRVERQRLKGRSWIQLNCCPRLTSRNLLRSNSRASMWMLVAVECAVENQPLRVGLLERERRRRRSRRRRAGDQGDGLRRRVDLGAVAREGVVHPLEGHRGGGLEEHAPPPCVVGDERRARMTVDGHRLDVPDAVERRLRRAAAILGPALSRARCSCPTADNRRIPTGSPARRTPASGGGRAAAVPMGRPCD